MKRVIAGAMVLAAGAIVALLALQREHRASATAAAPLAPNVNLTNGVVEPAAWTPPIFIFVVDGDAATSKLTELSIWTAASNPDRLPLRGFSRMNVLEKLLIANDYRVAIHSQAVLPLLRADLPVTVLNAGSSSPTACDEVAALTRYLQGTISNRRPVLGYVARGAARADLDRCIGSFTAYLQTEPRYAEAITIVMGATPVVRLPASAQRRVARDPARPGSASDIAPTLYALLGYQINNPGLVFGSPLFVPTDQTQTTGTIPTL